MTYITVREYRCDGPSCKEKGEPTVKKDQWGYAYDKNALPKGWIQLDMVKGAASLSGTYHTMACATAALEAKEKDLAARAKAAAAKKKKAPAKKKSTAKKSTARRKR